MEIAFNCLDMSEIDMDEVKPNRLNLRLFDYIHLYCKVYSLTIHGLFVLFL